MTYDVLAYIVMIYMLWANTDPSFQPYRLYSYGLYSHSLYSRGLYSYGLYTYGLHTYDLYSHGLYSHGLYGYGLYSYDLYSYGPRWIHRSIGPTSLPLLANKPHSIFFYR